MITTTNFRLQLNNIIFFIILLTNYSISSQNAPPAAEFKKLTWNPHNISGNGTQTQDESGSDWWYVHRNLYDPNSGKQIGYLAGGYSNFWVHHGSENDIRNLYNEGSGSLKNFFPNYTNFFTGTFTPTDNLIGGECEEFYNWEVDQSDGTSPYIATIARLDMQGNILWLDYTGESGDGIVEIVQDGQYFYVIGKHNGAKSLNVATRQFLKYNPTSTSSNFFNTTTYTILNTPLSNDAHPDISGSSHMYIAKYDFNGNKLWENIYGSEAFNTADPRAAWNSYSEGMDLVLNSADSKLYALGRSESGTNPKTYDNPFILRIDPTNGYVLNTGTISSPTIQNTNNENISYIQPRSMCQINSNGDMAIGGVMIFNNNGNYPHDLHRGFVTSVVSGTTFAFNSSWPNWNSNPITFSANSGSGQTSSIWEINPRTTTNSSQPEVLVGLMTNCDNCLTSDNNYAEGQVIRLSASNGSVIGTHTLGPINAYDLRIGVIETSDHGFAAVSSSRRTTPAAVQSLSLMGTYSTCPGVNFAINSGNYGTFDTDPLIIKFKADNSLDWIWNEDVNVPSLPRTLTPGDFKRQECMYKISESYDGGLVVSGNSSIGHDDNYMVKLYGDCGKQLSYDYTTTTLTFANSTTLTGNIKIKSKVIIPSGYTLTISGTSTKIQFADSKQVGYNCGIEIQPGGFLKLENGALLTSIENSICPGSMWDGISVVGNPTLSQGTYVSAPNQGYLSINSASISNARCAVITGHWEDTPSNAHGGLIDAFDAFFINNERDVEVLTYTIQNTFSRFRNCHFLITDELNNRREPVFRLFMENVKLPMPLQGNEFKYTAGNAYLPMQRGWGIYSNNADYEVGDFVVSTSSTQTVFQDFKIAIEANNTNNLKTIRVDHCNITNTFGIYDGQDWTGGISFHSVDNAQITRNNISIQCPFSFGVSINNSKLYGIRNNTVTGNGEMQSVGIYASNSGTGDHRIYRNTLNNLDGGIYAQYNNGNPFDQFGSDGLIMNCNTFNNNNGDIAMLTDNTIAPTVRKNQGVFSLNGTDLVRNRYSASCNFDNNWYVDISNGQNSNSNYQINHTTYSTTSSPYIMIPTCANTLVISNAVNTSFSFSNHCLELGNRPQIDPGCICHNCCLYIDIQDALSNSTASLLIKQNDYESNLDGGHTTSLLSDIANNATNEMSLLEHLTVHSPFLSDTVLTAYFNRASVPFENILEVHNSNKPVTSNVWQVLVNLALTEEQMNNLTYQQNENSISTRKLAEDDLGNTKSIVQELYGQKINYFMMDSLESSKDSVLALINSNLGNVPNIEILKVRAYQNKGDLSNAFNYVNELIESENNSEAAILEKILLQIDTASLGYGLIKVNSDILNTIKTYADDPSKIGHFKAKAVLKMAYGTPIGLHYLSRPTTENKIIRQNTATNAVVEPIGPENITNESSNSNIVLSFDTKNNTKSIYETNHTFTKLFPNPVNNEIHIYLGSRSSKACTFNIIDILGRPVMCNTFPANQDFVIDTREFINGIYFISLFQNKVLVENIKFTVIK